MGSGSRRASRLRVEAATAEEAIRGVLARREPFGRREARGVDRRARRRARRSGAGELTQAPAATRPSAASRNSCSSAVPTETRIAVRHAEPGERPDDDALAQQPLEQRGRVLAEVDADEVADGAGSGSRPWRSSTARRARSGPAALSARRRRDLGRVVDARECGGLRGGRQRRTAAAPSPSPRRRPAARPRSRPGSPASP